MERMHRCGCPLPNPPPCDGGGNWNKSPHLNPPPRRGGGNWNKSPLPDPPPRDGGGNQTAALPRLASKEPLIRFPPPRRGGGLGWGRSRTRGFTLLEVVVSLSISAILVGFIAMLVSTPIDAYIDQSARARMTDAAETVSRRFARDLRSALPNSVRVRNVGSRSIVEMLKVEAVSYYALPGSTPDANHDFDTTADDVFFSFGQFDTPLESIVAPYLIVGHAGAGTADDAYAGDGITSSFVKQPTEVDGQDRIELQGGFAFSGLDPLQRLFWVSGPIAYVCDTASDTRTLRRFSGYSINADIPTSASSSLLNGATNELIASNVATCRIECSDSSGSSSSNEDVCKNILVLEASIERPAPNARELIRVLEQISLR